MPGPPSTELAARAQTALGRAGVACSGWDPHHRPDGAREVSDVVNLGYVVNVIEDPEERRRVLRRAWSLTRRVLIVSARLSGEARDLRYRGHRLVRR